MPTDDSPSGADERKAKTDLTLDRLKGEFLARVSHELRTPLVTIKGYNELMLAEALGPLTKRQKRGLEIARANVERLTDLIESLLDLARMEEGRLSIVRHPFDLRDAVKLAVRTVQKLPHFRKLKVHVDLGAEPLPVVGDRTRIVQVMRTLLHNAAKFSEDHADEIDVRASLGASSVAVAVRDRGIGIPESERTSIFTSFYQVDGSITRRYGGAGLGLSLARELVHLHGGEIAVDSAPGQGSTFTVELPRAVAEAQVAQKSPGLRRARPRILVVEDEAEILDFAHFVLEREGYEVICATNGGEALASQPGECDLVVLDLRLKDVDGVELCRRLRAEEATRETPIVIVTAMFGDDVRTAVMAAGANGYLVKPFEVDELVRQVRELIGPSNGDAHGKTA
jgi:CheY-like chemotaxis protein